MHACCLKEPFKKCEYESTTFIFSHRSGNASKAPAEQAEPAPKGKEKAGAPKDAKERVAAGASAPPIGINGVAVASQGKVLSL